MSEDLETLKKIDELLKRFTHTDKLFEDTIWMSHVLHATGFLRDAIRELERNPHRVKSNLY